VNQISIVIKKTGSPSLDNSTERLYLTYGFVNQVANNIPAERLDLAFAALADPKRRAILRRLLVGEASVAELAEPFDISGPAISKHLKTLKRAGLISRSRDAQRRPCRLEAGALKEAADWLDQYRRFWEESLDRLEEYVRDLQRGQKKRKR
jgi:DNA-binding transcriptional ArsR family regulator